MIKYRKITAISLVTYTISKKRYLKCRYDTDTDTDVGDKSTIFSIHRPTSSLYRCHTLIYHVISLYMTLNDPKGHASYWKT